MPYLPAYRKLLVFACIFLSACSKMPGNTPPSLELVFADDTYQLTGVAISKEGRLFTNYPLWSNVYKYAAAEISQSSQENPYPDIIMNSWKNGDDGTRKWVCVQSVVTDDKNYLWVVDPASPKMEGVYNNSHKLVKINLANNSIEKTYFLGAVADAQSYINDVRIDNVRGFAYLTNSQEGGIVVINLATGAMKQVLQGHYSVISDPAYTFIIDGRELKKNGKVVKINSDGIALTPDGSYLYYKPLTDDKLYRIKTDYLRDFSNTNDQLASHVEDLGHFTATDGMIFDNAGNLYLGDMQHYRMMKIAPDLTMTELIKDDRLIWPDSYSLSTDGYLYISCSQINKQPEYNEGINKRTSPYTIYRIKVQ